MVINGSHSAGPEIGHDIQSAFLLPCTVFANVTKLFIADLGVRLVISRFECTLFALHGSVSLLSVLLFTEYIIIIPIGYCNLPETIYDFEIGISGRGEGWSSTGARSFLSRERGAGSRKILTGFTGFAGHD